MAKVVLELPDRTLRNLKALAGKQDLDLGELIQRAVALYGYAVNRTADGAHNLSITGPDNTVLANIRIGNEPSTDEGGHG